MKTKSIVNAPVTEVREEIIVKLYDLFRRAGYDGVSLSDISAATGLGKSSLYHHFPGGKPDMAAAVTAFAHKWMTENIYAPLEGDAPLTKKITAMVKTTGEMYERGGAPCLVASLMLSPCLADQTEQIGAILTDWIDALTNALKQAGMKPAEASQRAIEALVATQGALLVARAARNLKVFTDTMKSVRKNLLI